ncbi:MAG: hypothetical protein ACOY45_09645 [Pseudomonadota bacterium]
MALVRAYVAMMARIEATERLHAITDHAAGAGMLDDGTRRRVMRRLEQAAHGGRRRAAKATPAVLHGMGIRIVHVASTRGGKSVSDG